MSNQAVIANTFLILLVLGLPPLTIWSGKTAANLKGWKWTALPLLIYVNLLYVIGTAASARVVLTETYQWKELHVGEIETLIKNFGLLFFVVSACLHTMKKPIQAAENG